MTADSAPVARFLTDSLIFDWKAQSFRADLIFILPLALCLALGIGLGRPGAASAPSSILMSPRSSP
jgi:hypothetical protein